MCVTPAQRVIGSVRRSPKPHRFSSQWVRSIQSESAAEPRLHDIRQDGVAQEYEEERHPVTRRQRYKAQGLGEWQDDADRSNDEAGCNDRRTGPALQERHPSRADDVDDERLGQQALDEPTGLEQCGFVPSMEDGEHHKERHVVEDRADRPNQKHELREAA